MMTASRPLARTLGAPQSIQGIALDAGTRVYFGLDDRLALCIIREAQDILGVPCAPGPVHFHPSGQLARATLARDFEHRGVAFRRGTQLVWNEDGTLRADLAADDQRIGDVALPGRAQAHLCRDGQLVSWSRRIQEEEAHDGVRCEAGSVVTFTPNGTLERATLAEDAEIDGLLAMGGSDVEWHRNGQVSVLTLGAPALRGGIVLDAGTCLVLRDDRSLSVAQLAEELVHDGVRYPAGSYLQFDQAERLTSFTAITWRVAGRARS
jgi:hypothetical protein